LESGNLRLSFERGTFSVSYYERQFPISPRTYCQILGNDSNTPRGEDPDQTEYWSIVAECHQLPDRCEGPAVAIKRHRMKEGINERLADLAERSSVVRMLIEKNVRTFNGVSGEPKSFDLLDNLLRHQCFRLASWKTAPDEINYRRFFDVNDLAALAMERPEVFEATHSFVLSLLAQNKIAGLRIDHPDGLYDPDIYFRRLQAHYVLAVSRELAKDSPEWEKLRPILLEKLNGELPSVDNSVLRKPLYVLGEKILARSEPLPGTWQISGTTGYEFLNMTNGLFVDSSSADEFSRLYHDWIEDDTPFEEIVYRKKKLILEISLASELNMLTIELKRIAERSRRGIDYSLHGLLLALKELIACFPVYRSYISDRGPSELDRQYIQRATDAAVGRNPKTEASIFAFIRDVLLEADAAVTKEELAAWRHFAGKFQQLSSPVTAKGIEDTAFYIYNRLLSLNEVGGDPSHFGVSPGELHAFFAERQRDWPLAMSTLSTHDTKRSEDVRARMNVLSEMPREWQERLAKWGSLNAIHRGMIDGVPAPDRNEEYALYQTLLGAWPLDVREMASFKQRTQDWMLKSMREAKVHTSWTDPNKMREEAVHHFIETILDKSRAGKFLNNFAVFQKWISHCGFLNSLAQTLIKLTAPGVPDTYQGTEIWDFSLVDPDNRRPVDFDRRMRLMNEMGDLKNLLDVPKTGGIKLAVHQIVLKARNKCPALFTSGEYVPVQVGGGKSEHIFSFARHHEGKICVVAVPRLISQLIEKPGGWPLGGEIWGDTSIELPAIARAKEFRNLFTDAVIKNSLKIPAADLFGEFPVAFLISE